MTSLNGVYDQDTGTTAYSVIWYSLLGNRTATGTVDLAANENYLTSAPGGWVTTTSDTEAGTTTLTYHGTNGSSRSLGTLAQTGASEPVCDEESVVVTAATYPSSAAIVRIPFDGSGPVIVRTESLDADPAPWPRALSVDGDDVLGIVTPQHGWEPSPVGRVEVWHHDGTTTTPVVTAPEGSRVEGGAVGPDGVLVCLSHPDLSGGCDGRFFPTTGPPTQGELPESGLFWRTSGGFIQGCNGASGTCVDLYRITTPGLAVNTLYRARQPLDIGRWGGADRYAVAAKISAESFTPGSLVFLASGTGFADALAVGGPGRQDRCTHPAHHPRPDAGRHRGRAAPAHPVTDLGRRGPGRGLRCRLPQGPDAGNRRGPDRRRRPLRRRGGGEQAVLPGRLGHRLRRVRRELPGRTGRRVPGRSAGGPDPADPLRQPASRNAGRAEAAVAAPDRRRRWLGLPSGRQSSRP